jgi:hypothetical protein
MTPGWLRDVAPDVCEWQRLAREATSSGNSCPALGSVRFRAGGELGPRAVIAGTTDPCQLAPSLACPQRSIEPVEDPESVLRSVRRFLREVADTSDRWTDREEALLCGSELPVPNLEEGSLRSRFRLARDEKAVHERRVHVALEVIPTRIRRHGERHVLYVVRACLDLGADDRRRRRVRAIEEVPVMRDGG